MILSYLLGGLKMDKFYEQLLTTKKNTIYLALNILMYLFGALMAVFLMFSFLIFNFSYLLFSAINLILLFLIRYLRDNQYREYEYIFTNGNLQIDVIYSKKRRKTLIDEDVRNFQEFGKVKDVKIDNGIRKIKCIPWDNKNEQYIFIIGNNKNAVIIAPNDEMLKLINLYYMAKIR